MQTKLIPTISLLISSLFLISACASSPTPNTILDEDPSKDPTSTIHPISHATAVIEWGEATLYTDPVGGAAAFEGQAPADIILVTDIHGDHMNADTLLAVLGDADLIVPQAVKDQLPSELTQRATVLNNDETWSGHGLTVLAVPMYNLPESEDTFHTKGRGNGYVVEDSEGKRLYIAGDTSGIPEMRALKNIEVALIPMNLPYTMDVEEAADAVLEFKPHTVYPYHYRSQGGLSDVNTFQRLVNEADPEIQVILENWYPEN